MQDRDTQGTPEPVAVAENICRGIWAALRWARRCQQVLQREHTQVHGFVSPLPCGERSVEVCMVAFTGGDLLRCRL